jgi:hypothetical protein
MPVRVVRLTAAGEEPFSEIEAPPADRFDPELRRLMV